MDRCDVVVVGAGAMGSSAAWWLARRGRSVVLLEQFEQGHGRGSSHGSTRIFRFAYPDARYVAMAMEALPLWRELEDDAGAVLLETTGGVDHGDPAAIEATAGALSERGAAHERLEPEDAAERWPGMRFDRSVLFHPAAGRCLADATVRALQDRAGAHGADVRFSTGPAEVTRSPSGDPAVRAAGDEWRPRAVVVTAGAWVEPTTAGLLRLPPLRVTREQIQHFTPREPDSEWPSFIHHRQPWTYGLRSPGEGVKVAAHHVGAEVHPDRRTFAIDPAAQALVRAYVEEWFPGLDPRPVHPATCLYTSTPNEEFVLEREGRIVVGSPCSGHGFKFTPLIGRRLADLADEAIAAA